MRLSIIIPFHQEVSFLEDCFDSVIAQGLSDYEVVLVMDHVTEDITSALRYYEDKLPIRTVELADKITLDEKIDKRTIFEKHLEHSGVAKARNKGLEVASGEYIYFLDSDDYLMENSLKSLLEKAEGNKYDILYGSMQYTWFKRKVYLSSIDDKNSAEDTDIEGDVSYKEKKLTQEEKIAQIYERLDASMEKEEKAMIAEAYYHLLAAKTDFANVTILHTLIRRTIIEEQKLRFHEDYRFFSDEIFLVDLLGRIHSACAVEEAVYIKRKHNDPIHYPALCQAKLETKYQEFILAYKETLQIAKNIDSLLMLVDEKLLHFYIYTFAYKMRRSEEKKFKTKYFNEIAALISEIPEKNMVLRTRYERKLVHAAIRGNAKNALLQVNTHLGLKKLKKIHKNKRVFAYYLYFKFFSKMSVKENWVICESFFGKSYSDSPKYIYEYLCKNYPGKYKFIWVVNDRTKIPYHPTKVKRFSIRYCYYLARCKYNVFNVRQPEWMRKREGNVFLETWHGTPLKKLVFDQEEVCGASPLYKAQFYRQSRLWDYLVSANHFSTECFKSAFLFDKPILEYGYPRNDILYSENKEELITNLKKKLKIPADKKTILYAPTWRDDEYYGRGQYKFQLKLDLHLLKKLLGDEYVVLLRTHYFIADQLDVTGLEDFAINLSKYDDISELYLVSDMLITDYSSVFFDYSNLKRPILFYTYDLEKYRDMLRGFYLDIEKDVPGPLLFTTEEVADAIKRIDEITEEYKERYDEFYERFCSLEDGHASEKIAKEVFQLN